ncbi:MAG: hypothetical protein RIR70_1987 [Pseudomonadota bacterium]
MSYLRAAGRLFCLAVHVLVGLALAYSVLPLMTAPRGEALRVWWSRRLLRLLGVTLHVEGTPHAASLLVANHLSWLDVFVIHTAAPAVFVCKSEVKSWPVIGALVKKSGTHFIERGRARAAAAACHSITASLNRGQRVAIFPEGTTTDGRCVQPFRSALIEAAIAAQAPLQPVALRYSHAAPIYVGDTTIMQSLCRLCLTRETTAWLHLLPAVDTAHATRGLLAEHARNRIMRRLSIAPDTTAETHAGLPAETPSTTRPTDTPNPAQSTPAAA